MIWIDGLQPRTAIRPTFYPYKMGKIEAEIYRERSERWIPTRNYMLWYPQLARLDV